MPRNHQQERWIATVLRRLDRSQALLAHTHELGALARRALHAVPVAEQRRRLWETEQQVRRELVTRYPQDDGRRSG